MTKTSTHVFPASIRRLRGLRYGRRILAAAALGLALGWPWQPAAQAQSPAPAIPQVNIPYLASPDPARGAIFWFGQVDADRNYADVRIVYNQDRLVVAVHVFDRRLWYDATPTPAEIPQHDSVSLYLQPGNGQRRYRFDVQLRHYQTSPAFQAAYTWDGSRWVTGAIPFAVTAGWRGNAPNDNQDDRGWLAVLRIPFASLAQAGPPSGSALWYAGLALHDRDGASIVQPNQRWPAGFTPSTVSTWGRLRFGIPRYTPPAASGAQVVRIRQGLNGATVPDAAVGGHTNCGAAYGPGYFSGWGSATYPRNTQVNIQNQWDVADWPCFSKYFVTFPLNQIPAGKAVLSATLTMYLFGNAGYQPGDAQPSLIQAARVDGAWDEATLSWNRAPAFQENIAAITVNPVSGTVAWPGVAYRWDVSRAVAAAYAAGMPLRLALYSPDSPYHSGKYFSSSNVADWNAAARPTLEVRWGEPSAGSSSPADDPDHEPDSAPADPTDLGSISIFLPAVVR